MKMFGQKVTTALAPPGFTTIHPAATSLPYQVTLEVNGQVVATATFVIQSIDSEETVYYNLAQIKYLTFGAG
jgi:hypothetical protein